MSIGIKGESIARIFLQRFKSYQYIECNYRMRFGEIDLIMKDKNQYVFVEVKTRHIQNSSTAAWQIPYCKVERLERAILDYVRKKSIEDWRMELVSIQLLPNNRAKVQVAPI